MLSAMAAGLVACGGDGAKLGGGRDGAAQAAFQASQPAGRGKLSQQMLDEALASGALSATFSTTCSDSGKVSMTLDVTNLGQNGEVNYSVTYDNCNEDGANEYNGTLAMSFKVTPEFTVVTGMKGKLTIEGDISDYLETDVKLTMGFNATSTRSGSVKLVLDGTVKTSGGDYVYTNETLNITAGELPGA
jgi:hypothetical protein